MSLTQLVNAQYIPTAPEIKPVIIETGLDSITMYENTIRYLKKNYTDFEAVERSSQENEFIRFTGFKTDFSQSMGYSMGLRHTALIEFKNNKYRFSFEKIEMEYNGTFSDFKLNEYFKSNGDIKGPYKKLVRNLFISLNEVVKNHESSILTSDSDEEW